MPGSSCRNQGASPCLRRALSLSVAGEFIDSQGVAEAPVEITERERSVRLARQHQQRVDVLLQASD